MGRRRTTPGQNPRPAALPAERRYDRAVREDEFNARVRRHIPSSIVEQVAILGAEFGDRATWLKSGSMYPWVLAEIARVAVVRGTDFNRRPATRQDIVECAAAYLALTDRDLHRQKPGAVGEFLLRIAGEQLTYQQEPFHDLARAAAIFTRTTPVHGREPKVARPGWDLELFGCSLSDYLNTAFLLHVGALKNSGVFDPGWLDQPNFEQITEHVSAAVLRAVMSKHFVADRARLIEAQREANARTGPHDPAYRRYGFNPLTKYPVVGVAAGRWHIPVPHLLLRKATTLGIFYAGLENWGKDFADDIGAQFEAYIGDQLRELPGADVEPEIEWGPARARQRSVDWIVVFPTCVLLVEAKSTRPTEQIRLGSSTASDDLVRILAKGIGQLNKSAKLITERHEAFTHIPVDRPIVGLLATMEPFHTVNTPFVSAALPTASIPWRVCSAEELEGLVRLGAQDTGQLLHDHMTDPERDGHSIKPLFEARPLGRSRILDAAWNSFSWDDQDQTNSS